MKPSRPTGPEQSETGGPVPSAPDRATGPPYGRPTGGPGRGMRSRDSGPVVTGPGREGLSIESLARAYRDFNRPHPRARGRRRGQEEAWEF